MAMILTRWNALNAHEAMMERFFPDQFVVDEQARSTAELGLDVVERDDSYVINAAVAGVDPKDVDISIEEDVLTIKGESRDDGAVHEDRWVRRELRYGSFTRSLRLPPTVSVDGALAKFANGMLRLTLPKKVEARPRSIKITAQGIIPSNEPAI